jgi:hypothetical protein
MGRRRCAVRLHIRLTTPRRSQDLLQAGVRSRPRGRRGRRRTGPRGSRLGTASIAPPNRREQGERGAEVAEPRRARRASDPAPVREGELPGDGPGSVRCCPAVRPRRREVRARGGIRRASSRNARGSGASAGLLARWAGCAGACRARGTACAQDLGARRESPAARRTSPLGSGKHRVIGWRASEWGTGRGQATQKADDQSPAGRTAPPFGPPEVRPAAQERSGSRPRAGRRYETWKVLAHGVRELRARRAGPTASSRGKRRGCHLLRRRGEIGAEGASRRQGGLHDPHTAAAGG